MVRRHVISMGIGPTECAVARLEINTKQNKPNLSSAYPSTHGMPTTMNCGLFGKCHTDTFMMRVFNHLFWECPHTEHFRNTYNQEDAGHGDGMPEATKAVAFARPENPFFVSGIFPDPAQYAAAHASERQ